MLLQLSDVDNERQTRLYAWANDMVYAGACARHIGKKEWFRFPWSRGKIYFHQSAYITSLVVAYARPFTASRSKPIFRLRDLGYSDTERALHEKLLDLRNQIYAHSDVGRWSVRPWKFDDFSTSIVNQPVLRLDPDEIATVFDMTEKASRAMAIERIQIIARYEAEATT